MKWETRFLQLAKHVSTWSKDPSTKCGAVIVRPDRTVASIGFNGLPRNVDDSPERLLDRDKKLSYIVHAEANAILTAREPLNNCVVYIWPMQPCCHCAASIIQVGIKEVHCPQNISASQRWGDSFDVARKMFIESGVNLYVHENLYFRDGLCC
jgi:dCMP deaminase